MLVYEEERKQKILEYISNNARTSVQELCDLLNVSKATVRRDLTELENGKLLKRTHGGAIGLHSVNFETTYGEREVQFQEEKMLIAKKAAEFIEDGDSLLIDSGTTTYCLVSELSRFKDLTVVTNSVLLMQELSFIPNIEIVSVGGNLRRNTMAFTGPFAESLLERIRVDKAFLATNGVDVAEGLTTPNIVEASIKSKMISIANQVYVLADHSKIGRVSFAKFGCIKDINACITSSIVSEELKNDFRKADAELCLV
jgi:DeoR family transcriptional regulator, fructose operon transcriptional repressor